MIRTQLAKSDIISLLRSNSTPYKHKDTAPLRQVGTSRQQKLVSGD